MSQIAIVYPLLVQVALTFAITLWLARLRMTGLTSREVRPEDVALGQPGWPRQTTLVGNAYRNQFELPVLFYVLALLVLVLRLSDILFVVLAWLFVASRLLHAYIHTTSNELRARGGTFGIGMMILLVMWIWFAIRVLTAGI